MKSELLFQRDEQEEDLTLHFAEYTNLELRSHLGKLIKVNLVYLYCESLIIKEVENDRETIKEILDHCKNQEQDELKKQLSLGVLFELRMIEDELKRNAWSREQLVGSILNLIIENTLLNSSLSKFAYD